VKFHQKVSNESDKLD